MLCKCVLTAGKLHVTGIGMLHVNRNKVGRSVVHKIIFSVTKVTIDICLVTSLIIFMEWIDPF